MSSPICPESDATNKGHGTFPASYSTTVVAAADKAAIAAAAAADKAAEKLDKAIKNFTKGSTSKNTGVNAIERQNTKKYMRWQKRKFSPYQLHPNISAELRRLEESFDPARIFLHELVVEHKLPLPGETRYFSGGTLQEQNTSVKYSPKCMFMYTDLAPDSILASICFLEAYQSRLVDEPVAVYAVGSDGDDSRLHFKRRMMLALFALGESFIEELHIVADPNSSTIGEQYGSYHGTPSNSLEMAAKRLVKQVVAAGAYEATVDFLIFTPGHGHLEEFGRHFKREALAVYGSASADTKGNEDNWAELKERIHVTISSGTNKLTGYSDGDLKFLQELGHVTLIGHETYVGDEQKMPKIRNLGSFFPTIGRDLFHANPYLAFALQSYAEESNKHKVAPNLLFRNIGQEMIDIKDLHSNDLWAYVQAVAKSEFLMNSIQDDTAKSILHNLAEFGFHSGPLDSVLCYLNAWLLEHEHSAVDTSRRQKWYFGNNHSRDSEALTDDTDTQSISYICPVLAEPDNIDVIDRLSEEFKNCVLDGCRLEVVKITNLNNSIVDDRNWHRIDERFTSRFLRGAKLGYKSLMDSHSLDSQRKAFYRVLTSNNDDSKPLTHRKMRSKKHEEMLQLMKELYRSGRADHAGRIVEQPSNWKNISKTLRLSRSIKLFQDSGNKHVWEEMHHIHQKYIHDQLADDTSSFTADFASGFCFAEKPSFETSNFSKQLESMWKQNWIHMIFMAHIESFNFTGPLASAAKFFIKNLPLEDTFSDSLPPAGSNGSGDSKMRVETQKDQIVYVRVSADAKYVIYASKYRVELKRIDDGSHGSGPVATQIWSYEVPKDTPKDHIVDVAYGMKVKELLTDDSDSPIQHLQHLRDFAKRLQKQAQGAGGCHVHDSMLMSSTMTTLKSQHRIAILFENRLEYFCFASREDVQSSTFHIEEMMKCGSTQFVSKMSQERVKSTTSDDADHQNSGELDGHQEAQLHINIQFTHVRFSVDTESLGIALSMEADNRLEILRVEDIHKRQENTIRYVSKGRVEFGDTPANSAKVRGSASFWQSTYALEKKYDPERVCQFSILFNSEITCFDFSPTGNRIVVGGKYNADENSDIAAIFVLPTVDADDTWKKTWEHTGGKRWATLLTLNEDDVREVGFSASGEHIVLALENLVQVHDGASGSFKYVLSSIRHIRDLSFSSDGTRFAVASALEEKALSIYDVLTGKTVFRKEIKGGSQRISFSPCDSFLAIGSANVADIIKPDTGKVLFVKERKDAKIETVASSPCGTFFAFGYDKVEIVDLKTGCRLGEEIRTSGRVVCLSISECEWVDNLEPGQRVKAMTSHIGAFKAGIIHDIYRNENSEQVYTIAFSDDKLYDNIKAHQIKQEKVATILAVASLDERSSGSTNSNVNIYSMRGDKVDKRMKICFKECKIHSMRTTRATLSVSFTCIKSTMHGQITKGMCWLISWRDLFELERSEGTWHPRYFRLSERGLDNLNDSELFMPKSEAETVFIGFDGSSIREDDNLFQRNLPKDLVAAGIATSFPPLTKAILALDVTDGRDRVVHDGYRDTTGTEEMMEPLLAYGGLCGRLYVFKFSSLLYSQSGDAEVERIASKSHMEDGNPAAIRSCVFIPNSRFLAVAGDFRGVQCYDPEHNCLPMFSIETGFDLGVNISGNSTYSLAFTEDGRYGAAGDSNGVLLFELYLEEERSEVLFKLKSESRAFPSFCYDRKNESSTKAKLIVSSNTNELFVYDSILENGPPISRLDEDVESTRKCLQHNPLLPLFTRISCTLLDRAIHEILNATGRRKLERYNNMAVILNSDCGPQSIQHRHFLLAVMERDEQMLWLILKAASSKRAAQRARFAMSKMLPYIVQAQMTSALARLFDEDLRMQDTGCEMHAVDAQVDARAYLWKGVGTCVADLMCLLRFPSRRVRDFRTLTSVQDAETRHPIVRLFLGGRRDEQLHEDKITSHPYFDHFEPWSHLLNEEKGVLATAYRSPLPALGSRIVLSQLSSIRNASISNRIFGSEVLACVIKSIWWEKFRTRHIIFTSLFIAEVLMWWRFNILFKHTLTQDNGIDDGVTATAFFYEKILSIFLAGSDLILFSHEILQQSGIRERRGGEGLSRMTLRFLYEFDIKDIWNIFDFGSQLMVLLCVGLTMYHSSNQIALNPSNEFDGSDSTWFPTPTRDFFLVLLSVTTIMLLGKSISYLRGFTGTAWIVVVLLENLADSTWFIVLMLICIFFFTGSFWMLFANIHMDEVEENNETEEIIDDTVEPLHGNAAMSLPKVFEMGLLGGFSTNGFDKSASLFWTWIVFALFMIFLQIVALNALIAFLGDSFSRVLTSKESQINQQFAHLMVEYMDTWEGPLVGWHELSQQKIMERENDIQDKRVLSLSSRLVLRLRELWIFANGSSLEELESSSLWTHQLRVSSSRQKISKEDQIYSLLTKHIENIDGQFRKLYKEIDDIKTEVLEVRKDGERNMLIQLKRESEMLLQKKLKEGGSDIPTDMKLEIASLPDISSEKSNSQQRPSKPRTSTGDREHRKKERGRSQQSIERG